MLALSLSQNYFRLWQSTISNQEWTSISFRRKTQQKNEYWQKKLSTFLTKWETWKFIKKKLASTQKSQKRQANNIKADSSNYKVDDLVWLFIKNIKTNKSFKKLNRKMIDFYKVLKILKKACQLNLFSSMKIHNNFYISLLRTTFIDSLTNQIQFSSSSIIVNEKEKYEVNDILNNRYHYNKL